MVDLAPPSPAAPNGPARSLPDFSDTEKTFSHLSDAELRQASWLFGLMGKTWLSNVLSRLGAWAVRIGLPGAAWAVRKTIYEQFVGGTSVADARPTMDRLLTRGVSSILDYGVEAKSEESDFDALRDEVAGAIDFGASVDSIGSVVVKITGLAPNELLETYNERSIDFDAIDDPVLQRVVDRLDALASRAKDKGLWLYIDAEESWYQNTIDRLADEMMRRYNRERVVVLNTYQLYRHDRLAFLKASYARAEEGGYMLGTKLVRGAYMVKEAEYAEKHGKPTTIQPTIEATHADFNAAVRFCMERHGRIACTVGTHNEESTRLGAKLIDELGIPRDHPHLVFAQLLGMSDNLTFNLAAAGFNAAKYVVYGPVKEVLPYLVRRAQENSSVTGEMGRELKLLRSERKRRRTG